MVRKLKRVVELGRERGIPVIVDGAQSFGLMDVDLGDMQPDFYSGSAHKWICGPKENGVLYINGKAVPLDRVTLEMNGERVAVDERRGLEAEATANRGERDRAGHRVVRAGAGVFDHDAGRLIEDALNLKLTLIFEGLGRNQRYGSR